MPPGPSGSPARRVLRAAYLVACNTILLALLLEVGVRLFVPPTSDLWAPDRVAYTLHPYFQTANSPIKRTDPGPLVSGWWVDPRKNAWDPGRKRVLFLGGSTTNTDYPREVRKRLEAELGPVTGFNLGNDWHCSLHSLYKLWTYADELQPDLVVVLHNINDFYRGFTPPEFALSEYRPDYSHYAGGLHTFWSRGTAATDDRSVFYALPKPSFANPRHHEPDLGGLVAGLVGGSELVRVARALLGMDEVPHVNDKERVQRLRQSRTVAMDDELVLRSLPSFVRNMENIRATCQLREIPVLFLTMPFQTDIEAEARGFMHPAPFLTNDGTDYLRQAGFGRGLEHFNEAVRELADEPHAFVLDLAAEITDLQHFDDEVHLMESGTNLKAELVASYVLESKLLEPR
jgi:hypothetical protein